MRGYYGDGYVGWPWVVVGQQEQVPTPPELIAQLQTLDSKIQQTNREIAAHASDAAQAKFVSQYWRPFVTLWRDTKDVYQAGTRQPGSAPLVELLSWFMRMRARYHELLHYAVMGVGFEVSIPPEFSASP